MQVFYNEAPDPIPINTDPVLEVDAVHKACKASLLKGYYVLIAISGIMSFFFLSSLISDTLRILASPTNMFKGLIWLLLLILILVEVLTYFRWYRKAKKQAEHEIFLETPSTAKFQKIAMGLLVIFLLNWILNIVLVDNPVLLWCCALVAVVIILDHILIQVVKNHLKKKNVSANMNKALTILFSFVFVFVMMGTVVYGGLHFFDDHIRENLPSQSLEAPLHMEDLVHQDSDYVAYLMYVSTLLTSIRRIVEFAEQFQRGMTGIERFCEIVDIEPSITDAPDARPMERVKGEIRFDNVRFRYSDEGGDVLSHLDLTVKPGESIALVGPSGGGKTTLCNLIPRFYDLSDGCIRIDGTDVREITLATLRQNIGV
ncbi:MAG: ABC transporter ATP-binding protein, partial [Firmicutes bacterium]|nr:ABC transporter ATP-binding protein [Bacillota bacterium]